MAHINQARVSAFRKARDNLVTLLEQQSTFLRHDIDSRAYVIPNLRLQLIQHIDIVASLSRKMAVESRHHPYVLVQQSGFYETVVPMHCAAIKGQCAYLADRLRDNLCTDIGSGIGLSLTTGLFLVYSTYRLSYDAMAIMPPRPGPVSAFKRERATFVSGLGMQARVLRADPQAYEDVSESLRELVTSVHRIKDTSMAMAVDARGNAYVLAKPYGFYSHNVPFMCNDLIASLLHWADILVNTDGRRTDRIVVDSIEGTLASLGF
ncbi:hypothetical protein DTO006G1_3371 [Penicillium roqueforti]|uniref:uncharacterized protein n=1 Tax=Penicillium roqueforti TaxID=5082 RepID=UPI001909A20C|nr:uncharacterized protein LCP9604111_6160 [Penicillium roqueforti]KAF9247461.1 hypothetical protein LCP9604111_6160 [Penicillium roqueforti]KAI1834801.1 hypothetical protein CBS147337_4355 [Penicillium roqueforti]KAI2676644.1 hypothetical protein CBS147355_5746 [Penicillium roqueforti]KAI2683519.1 hypothetical protein LCP963914a_5920 [Penicillium roqueforti]KAI2702959.1 hypothetical protein CBS147372_3274 [Penicillium roqueforti]